MPKQSSRTQLDKSRSVDRKVKPKSSQSKQQQGRPPEYEFTPGKYLIVSGNRVASMDSAESALQFALDHPGVRVFWSTLLERDVQRLRNDVRRDEEDKRLIPNPVAEYLWSHTEPLIEEIEDALVEDLGEIDLFYHYSRGTITEREHGLRERRKTNAECATWDDDLRIDFKFDLEQDLVAQFAEYLTDTATKLQKAARKVRRLTDDRNRETLRRLIHEKGLATRMKRQGLTLDCDGNIVTQEERDRQDAEIDATEGGAV